MSAGRGVRHSEFNHERTQETHFLQIWIEPNAVGITPRYEQKTIDPATKRGQLKLIASSDADDGSVLIHADAKLYAGLFDGDESAQLGIDSSRKAYVHLVKGSLTVNGIELSAGDALMMAHESAIKLSQGNQAEVLVFDLSTN
jgi:redox-sensitive bicupin YhaK (pirin superfamily)